MVRFLQEEIGTKKFLKYTLEGKRMRKVQIKKKLYMQISAMILCVVALTTLYSVNTFAKSEKNEVVGKVYEFDKNDDYDISESDKFSFTDKVATYGELSLFGNIGNISEKNGVPAYEVTSGNLDLYYTYSDALLKAEGGLTMSEVATIQKESKYPVELISKFNSMEQYKICKSSGLTAQMVDGKTALIRKIDLNYLDDMTGKTNLQLMQEGHAPLDPMGHPYELHHIGQKNDSPLAILTQEEHRGKGNDKIWHILTDNFDNPSSKNGWGKIKKKFWKDYAKQVVNGGI